MADETKLPERIWAYSTNEDMGGWVTTKGPQRTDRIQEYIRADRTNALVAAACQGLVYCAVGMADGTSEEEYIERQMVRAIPEDAQAALEAVKAEAEARGYQRGVEDAADKCVEYAKGLVPDNGRYWMETALPDAIRALAQKDKTDDH